MTTRLSDVGCTGLKYGNGRYNFQIGEPFDPHPTRCGLIVKDIVLTLHRESGITQGQKITYRTLVEKARKGICHPSFKNLADSLNRNERCVRRDVDQLRQAGLISTMGHGGPLCFKFLWHQIFEDELIERRRLFAREVDRINFAEDCEEADESKKHAYRVCGCRTMPFHPKSVRRYGQVGECTSDQATYGARLMDCYRP